MIVRPVDLIFVETNFEFNGLLINEVEIDLVHINFGRNRSDKRSDFDADFVTNVCMKFFSNKYLESIGQQWFEDELCIYFKLDGFFENKKYRIVVCFCTDKPNTMGVITLHKIEEK